MAAFSILTRIGFFNQEIEEGFLHQRAATAGTVEIFQFFIQIFLRLTIGQADRYMKDDKAVVEQGSRRRQNAVDRFHYSTNERPVLLLNWIAIEKRACDQSFRAFDVGTNF